MYIHICNIINRKYSNTNKSEKYYRNIIEFYRQEMYNERQTTWEYLRLS